MMSRALHDARNVFPAQAGIHTTAVVQLESCGGRPRGHDVP